MKVSLIIPTKNEEGCIGRVLAEVPRQLVDEIVVVDGQSSDNTMLEAKENLKKQDKLIEQRQFGYGAAFLEGIKFTTGDVIIMMDADGSHNPKDIGKIIDKFREGYEFIMASRYVEGGKSDDDTLLRLIGNKLFTWMTNLVHGTDVTDSLFLFTAISKKNFNRLQLKSAGFEFCTEIIVKAHKKGLKFAEVPVIERKRYAGESKVNSFVHGLKILRMILRSY